MFSQFYVLGPRGDSIVFRSFRSELVRSTAETFFRNVRFWGGRAQDAPPVFSIDGVHYAWIRKSGLFFVLTSVVNTSPAEAIELLVRVSKLLKDYCGVLTEESVRANFTLIYELLDEVFDWGYPQMASTDSLKAYVFNDPAPIAAAAPPESRLLRLDFGGPKTTPSTAVNKPITFRTRDKQKNQVYVDIFERLSLTFNSSGHVMNQAIDGMVQIKSYLAGNPELCLGLNEDMVVAADSDKDPAAASAAGALVLDDCNFHESVKLTEFAKERVLVLTPPDGEFVAMNYLITSEFRPPFRLFPFFELSGTHKLDLAFKVRADIPHQICGTNVAIIIPLPRTATSVVSELGSGAGGAAAAAALAKEQAVEYDEKAKVVRWYVKKFQGESEHMLRCRVALSEPADASVRKSVGPISMHFEVPMYSASGLQVRYLRARQQGNAPPMTMERWIRYVSRSNSYICRM